MNLPFRIGDTVKVRRTGSEVKIIEVYAGDPSLILCEFGPGIRAYFNIAELDIASASNPISHPSKIET